MSVQEATSTYDCKFPGCPREAKSSRGPYSYCDVHRGHTRQTSDARTNGNGNGTVAKQLKSLAVLAAEVDKAQERARRLTEQALAAKRDADAKAAEFRAEARRLLQDDEGEVRT